MSAVLGLLFEFDVCCASIILLAKCKHVWITFGSLRSLSTSRISLGRLRQEKIARASKQCLRTTLQNFHGVILKKKSDQEMKSLAGLSREIHSTRPRT